MIPHLLRCQGLAVIYTGFALGRLESEAPSTFALLGLNSLNRAVDFNSFPNLACECLMDQLVKNAFLCYGLFFPFQLPLKKLSIG